MKNRKSVRTKQENRATGRLKTGGPTEKYVLKS